MALVCVERGSGNSLPPSYLDTNVPPAVGVWLSSEWAKRSHSGTLGYVQIPALPLTGSVILDTSLDQFLCSLSVFLCEVC